MRFGICFCCNGDGQSKKPKDSGNTGFAVIPVPSTLTEQPKSNEPIHLDEVKDVSIEETPVPTVEQEKPPTPVAEVALHVKETDTQSDERHSNTPSYTQSYDKQQNTPSSAQFDSSSGIRLNLNINGDSSSSVNVNTSSTDGSLTMNMLAPGYFHGTYNGYPFTIINGKLLVEGGADNQVNKELIMKSYSRSIEGMQKGVSGMQAGMSAFASTSSQETTGPPVGTCLNINFTTNDGKAATIPLTTVGPGHYRGQYNGKHFTIFKGEVLTDGADDDLDKETILFQYNMAMEGMERGRTGMQRGMLQMQRAFNKMQSAADNNFQEPLPAPAPVPEPPMKRMRTLLEQNGMEYLKQDQLQRLLRKMDEIDSMHETKAVKKTEPNSEPRQMQQFEDRNTAKINHTPKPSPRNIPVTPNTADLTEDKVVGLLKTIFDMKTSKDEVDAYKDLPEPVAVKTTCTPTAVIYDDPKTYDPMDSYEMPPAKRADEYIISLDENVKAGNRYYFHSAKPKRVTRPKLNNRQLLQIASPEKYQLFQSECLKAHNEYRAMHGVAPLVHSEFLSEYAREWAEHLALKDAFYHRPKNEYGENLYRADRLFVPGKKAVTDWYDEIDLYDYNNPFFSKEVGHFTQLVWKDTREVGTGVAQLGEKIWVCCNYHPPGNHLDKLNDTYIPRPLKERIPKSK